MDFNPNYKMVHVALLKGLKEEIKRLRDALKIYADHDNWRDTNEDDDWIATGAKVLRNTDYTDGWEPAEQALANPNQMDPNTNLLEALRLALDIQNRSDRGSNPIEQDSERLAELLIALDKWLIKGGYLPNRWHQ